MPIILDGTSGITTPSLTNTGTDTLSAGTANGVTYLNGSKVLTSGTALVFDGTNLGVSGNANFGNSGSSNYGGYTVGGRIFSLAAAGGVVPAISASTDTTASSAAFRAYTKEVANDTSYAYEIQTGNGTGVTTQKLQLTWGANGLWNSTGLKLATNLGLGGTAPTSSGTGITFPATQSASSDANTLDDYEEGTWTPGMSPSSSGTINLNYVYTAGKYTKVGRLVVCTASIYVSSVSSPTGNLYVTGLPFTIGAPSSAGSCWANGFTSSANNLVLRIDNSSTQVLVQGFSSGSVAAAAPWVQAATEMNLTITYFV